jgi:hypothetical protein
MSKVVLDAAAPRPLRVICASLRTMCGRTAFGPGPAPLVPTALFAALPQFQIALSYR